MDIEDKFVTVGNLPTYITTCGDITNDTSILAVVIPGNPGVADYYNEYMQCLHEASGYRVPVWAVSHAGHVQPPCKPYHTKDDTHYYTLRGQIEHKLRFIEQHVPAHVKLILIGHSIGCYIIIHMLDKLPRERVLLCPLLFLTIERMATSPKGKVMTPMLKYCRWMLPYLMLPISFLPRWVHTKLMQWYFKGRPVHSGAIDATAKLASPFSIRNVTNMANEEMRTVDVPDYHLLQKFRHKLWFYYGSRDNWCPIAYCYDMQRRYPDADVTLCENGFEHAFCLEASREMAHLTWNKLNQSIFSAVN